MTKKNIIRSKKDLEIILQRQKKAAKVQMSAVKIINFLVNDMLDYALMQSGQFRKDIS